MQKSRQDTRQLRLWCFSIILWLIAGVNSKAISQSPVAGQVIVSEGGAVVVAEGTPGPDAAARKKGPTGKPESDPSKKAPEGGDKSEKKDAAKAEPVKRQSEPPAPPDKRELDVKPDDAGMVQFQFRNQAWPDVLRWLAESSSMSLDWQELPGDYLNLATRRPHTIEEARDLFNRHLLARGYTLLEIEGVLQVAKTENINPSLVPKVDPADLGKLPPNRFVRVSFPLESLIAEEVIDEFKMLISTNGKLIPLQSTNRLEAMDAAGNLKELYRIVTDEQSEATRANLAREFILKHVRASEVKTQLEAFLGIKSTSSSGSGDSSSSRQMQQMQEMMQQQMQQMQQRGGGENGKGAVDKNAKRSKDIYLVANVRQNSVIVHAQPDKMAIVEAFIKRIDVLNENAEDLSMFQNRMQVFRLTSISPKELVTSLLSMDILEPTTRLEVNNDNKSIIAIASLADQYAIQKVIERLDGSARNFDMIQLRRLRADEVAGSIKFLMGTEKEKKEDNSRSRYYGFYDFNQNNDDKNKQTDAFRVGANVADNQLILWCNENERKEVNKLLVKLGELPPEGAKPSPFRTIDASRSRDTLEYLLQLQEKWKSISPNPLVLPKEDQFDEATVPKPENEPTSKPDDTSTEASPVNAPIDTSFSSPEPNQPNGRYIRTEGTDRQASDETSPASNATQSSTNPPNERLATRPEQAGHALPPAVEIRFDAQGNLLLMSDDIAALDQLESLMLRDAPPKRPYDVFKVVHTRASYIAINLEDYFKDETKNSKNENSRNTYYFFDAAPSEKKKDDPQLGSRRELKFIWDNETSTIVAIGATDAQRKLIKELIELWDTPDPKKAKDGRFQRLVQVRYSKAEAIEQAIKDAYRDFLTENDKTFDRNAEDGKKGGEKRDRSDSDRKFSMGVDSVTNIIIVSAEGEDLLNVICQIIDQLDLAAKPSGSLEVVQFETGGSTKSMEKALKALMESAKKAGTQEGKERGQKNNGQNNEGNGGQNNGDR